MFDDPDRWWHSLPYDRRMQIWRWIDPPSAGGEVAGQVELFDVIDPHTE